LQDWFGCRGGEEVSFVGANSVRPFGCGIGLVADAVRLHGVRPPPGGGSRRSRVGEQACTLASSHFMFARAPSVIADETAMTAPSRREPFTRAVLLAHAVAFAITVYYRREQAPALRGAREPSVHRSTLFRLKVDNKKSLITKTSSTASGPPSPRGKATFISLPT